MPITTCHYRNLVITSRHLMHFGGGIFPENIFNLVHKVSPTRSTLISHIFTTLHYPISSQLIYLTQFIKLRLFKTMSQAIPIFNDLSCYSNPDANTTRYQNLTNTFQSSFTSKPDFFSRSPGRVNLMGDHIDYNQFSVLPMAIDFDVVAAVGKSDTNTFTITNTNSDFTEEKFELPSNGDLISIDKNAHSWGNYFKCSLIVAQLYVKEKYPEKFLNGLNFTFDGTVPTGGGLSSSAAFCVTSTLAILHGNDITISKTDLTKITVVCEHYVGVNTGGMDQCASIYGEMGKCLLIQFSPELKGSVFEFPSLENNDGDDLAFLISNSLETSNKHETAPIHYNLRVVEMAVATELLANKFNYILPNESNLKCTGTLKGFMDKYYEQKGEEKWDGVSIDIGTKRLNEMLELTENFFTEEQRDGFTIKQISKQLEITEEEFRNKYLSTLEVRFDKLQLYKRTRHVFYESLNVLKCLELLRGDNKNDFLKKFGNIMNDSQATIKDFNQSSTEKLDEICKIALENGAYGSRVTGAGWGGSLVHLTSVKRLPKLVEALTNQFYKKHYDGITEEELANALVDTKPATGSSIIKL